MIKRETFSNYLWVLPAFLMFVVFTIYPFYKIFQLSFMEWDGISPTFQFVGLKNYINVIRNKIWWESFWHAVIITLLALTVQNSFALLLAYIVDKDVKLGKFYRLCYFLPPMLSGIVVGLMWNWIFQADGILNHILKSIGISIKISWLAEPKTALYSVAVIHMWKGFGWGFVIFLAGLQSIPRELYEAADIDGANSVQKFIHVTLPLLIPIMVLVSILTILGTMQIYDIIISTTGGGPGYHTEVPFTQIITRMTGTSQFGYACAMGLIFGFILLVVSMLQLVVSNLKTKYES